jgi:thiol-disulfide isomerase/thioredoxin
VNRVKDAVKNPMRKPHYLKRILFLTALCAVVVGSLVAGMAANRGTIVVFDANWCASCREIVPISREIAQQNNLGFAEIDVDYQNAPKQAQSYGLSIPNDEPPQVFYVDRGRATLLYNGRGARYGSGEAARATILQNLQRAR